MSVPTCYIIAGEVSGDRLGAGIMRQLRALHPEMIFSGIGGPQMQAQGLRSAFDYSELALMGFAEILPKALHLLGRINSTVEDIEVKQPDVVVTIDSPGFNFRVVEKAKKQGIRTKFIHVVAPTVWAYKEKRAATCAKLFDHLLVLLPFEPPYFEKVGLPTTFIGHPTVSAEQYAGDGESFRKRHHIRPNQTVIALLPGSRENEVKRHMSLMGAVMDNIAQRHPDLVMISSVPRHMRVTLNEYFMTSPHRSILTFNAHEKMDAFAAADVALVKSGTVSLEMAYAGTAMVVMYKLNALTAWIIRRMIKTPFASLVNIILGKPVIPEYIQQDATVENLTRHLNQLLENADERQAQQRAFKDAIHMLQKNDSQPHQEAAQIISKMALN